MNRLAALIEFAEHVSDEEARAALESIANVLEQPYRSDFGLSVAEIANRPEPSVGDYVKAYDDEWGSPTF